MLAARRARESRIHPTSDDAAAMADASQKGTPTRTSFGRMEQAGHQRRSDRVSTTYPERRPRSGAGDHAAPMQPSTPPIHPHSGIEYATDRGPIQVQATKSSTVAAAPPHFAVFLMRGWGCMVCECITELTLCRTRDTGRRRRGRCGRSGTSCRCADDLCTTRVDPAAKRAR